MKISIKGIGDEMKTKLYVQNDRFVAGMTLKDLIAPDENNMALHVTDHPEQVINNRKKLADFLHVELDQFVCANQTHSANFAKVTTADKGRGTTSLQDAIQNTDALYTIEPNIVLSSFTADCVPIMFYHVKCGLIGVVHSGWQGTVKEITRKLFHHLVKEENCNPEGFFVYIGSAINQEKFEVDEDVNKKFAALGYADEFIKYNAQTKKYHIDNQKIVKKQCEMEGIWSAQIFIDSTCTYKSDDGFSHRENKGTGRHLSFIMRK